MATLSAGLSLVPYAGPWGQDRPHVAILGDRLAAIFEVARTDNGGDAFDGNDLFVRLFDLDGHPISPATRVTMQPSRPPGVGNGPARIVAGAGRFLILWDSPRRQDLSQVVGGSLRTRWLSPDGSLSPEQGLAEPFPNDKITVASRPDGVSLLWSEYPRSPGTPVIYSLKRTLLSPTTPPSTRTLSPGGSPTGEDWGPHETATPDGGSWVVFTEMANEDDARLVLLRLSPQGEVLSRHERVMKARVDLGPDNPGGDRYLDFPAKPTILATDRGPLIAWFAGGGRERVLVLQATAEGDLSGKPAQVPAPRREGIGLLYNNLSLTTFDHHPMLFWDLAQGAASILDGSLPGPVVAPLLLWDGQSPTFLASPTPRVAWWELENQKLNLFLAPLACRP